MIEDFNKIKLIIDERDFAIVRSRKFYTNAFANISYRNEITVIIEESKIKKEDIIEIEKNWKLITFDAILEFDLVGFIAKISTELANQGISIFVLSSYFTDHILVKNYNLDKSIEVLNKLGMKLKI